MNSNELLTGCLVDGAFGIDYQAVSVLEIARDFGFWCHVPPEFQDVYDDLLYSSRSIDGMESAILDQGGLLDYAVDWLNDHVAPDGYAYGFHDGDFFLQSDEWWDQDV
jgi:hypothetical protein